MKNISLNGWQRLWVASTVLSLLLIVLTVWFRWPIFENFKDYPLYHESLSSEAQAWLIRPGTAEDWLSLIEISGQFPNGDRLLFKKGIKAEKMQAICREYASIVGDRVQRTRNWMLITAGAGWLGGSAALYVFGWAVAWIIRGFRPTGKGAHQN